jgi:hypothetical protein
MNDEGRPGRIRRLYLQLQSLGGAKLADRTGGGFGDSLPAPSVEK